MRRGAIKNLRDGMLREEEAPLFCFVPRCICERNVGGGWERIWWEGQIQLLLLVGLFGLGRGVKDGGLLNGILPLVNWM